MKLAGPIERLLQENVDMDYQAERILQLLRLEKSDAFDRGIQNIAPSLDDQGIVRITSFGVQAGQLGENDINPRSLDYNPRKTRSYRDKFVAVMGQRPFYNCTAEPNDPTNDQDRRGARQVNLLVQKLQTEWPMRQINDDLFFFLFKDGTVLGKVRPVTDGKQFGTTKIPNVVAGQVCLNCGAVVEGSGPPDSPVCPNSLCPSANGMAPDNVTTVAIQNGFNEYENTSIALDLLNGYFFTVPFNVKNLKTPWLIEEGEEDMGTLLEAYPNARDIVGTSAGGMLGNNAAETTGTTARMAAQSQMGTVRGQRTGMWSHRIYHVNRAQFQKLTNADERALALQTFPNGLKVVRIEDKMIALNGENLQDRFSYCQPSKSEYLFADGISWGLHGLDDAYSNLVNIAQQALESGIARYLVNPDYIDGDAMNRLQFSPTRFIEALAKTGETLDNAFKVFPTADYPAQLPQMMETIDTCMQHICGVLEQLFGEMPPNLTLGQARMMLNQGLMQLGTVANNATTFYEQTFTNGVNLFCASARFNPTFQGEQVDLDLIRRSKWTIKGGTVMPRSYAERQSEVMTMLTQNPQLADALKMTHPVNFGELTDMLDMSGFKNPDLDAVEALNEILDQLFQGQPIQAPMAPPDPVTGMQSPPQPPQPSIEFDSLVYPAQIAVQVCQAALLKASSKTGTPGYANVRAFMQAAQQAAMPPPPPMPPPKLSITGKIPDLTPEQEGAIFGDFGVTVPPPHPGAMQARANATQGQPGGPSPTGGGQPGPPGPPPSLSAPPPPGNLMQVQ